MNLQCELSFYYMPVRTLVRKSPPLFSLLLAKNRRCRWPTDVNSPKKVAHTFQKLPIQQLLLCVLSSQHSSSFYPLCHISPYFSSIQDKISCPSLITSLPPLTSPCDHIGSFTVAEISLSCLCFVFFLPQTLCLILYWWTRSGTCPAKTHRYAGMPA